MTVFSHFKFDPHNHKQYRAPMSRARRQTQERIRYRPITHTRAVVWERFQIERTAHYSEDELFDLLGEELYQLETLRKKLFRDMKVKHRLPEGNWVRGALPDHIAETSTLIAAVQERIRFLEVVYRARFS